MCDVCSEGRADGEVCDEVGEGLEKDWEVDMPEADVGIVGWRVRGRLRLET